jgi:hypothetical protein
VAKGVGPEFKYEYYKKKGEILSEKQLKQKIKDLET